MKRNLLTQIRSEWRENIWLVVELLVVTAVIWLIGILFYGKTKNYFKPIGYDYNNIYTVDLGKIVAGSRYYEGDVNDWEGWKTDLQELIERLNKNPHLEGAAYYEGALPNSDLQGGTLIKRFDVEDSVDYRGRIRNGSPELVRLMRLESATGKTTEQLEEILRRGDILISESDEYKDAGRNVMDLIGTRMYRGEGTSVYKVGDVIRGVRDNEYADEWGTIVFPMLKPQGMFNSNAVQVAFRVRDGHDKEFLKEFEESPELRRQRNVYLLAPKALTDIREEDVRETETGLRMLGCLMFFLLVTMFLGLTGTFWFRMRQRVGEIALRKVCGATRADIFRRVIGEGMILLLIAAALMSAIIWPMSDYFVNTFNCTRPEMVVFEAIAIALVALGIVVSLWYPARNAMRVEPAYALKSE